MLYVIYSRIEMFIEKKISPMTSDKLTITGLYYELLFNTEYIKDIKTAKK